MSDEAGTTVPMNITELLAEADALLAEAPDKNSKEFLLLLRGWIVDLKDPNEV